MKLPEIIKISATIVLLTALFQPTSLYGDAVVSSSITATATVLPPDVPENLIDDFDHIQGQNYWGGVIEKMDDHGSIEMNYDSEHAKVGDYCLALDYDVSGPDDWAGVFFTLTGDESGVDITTYTYLSFQVKGSTDNIPVKIELENRSLDADRRKSLLYINDYLDGGVTDEYQQVKIPLEAFANLDSFENVDVISFVFEEAYAEVNDFPKDAILYIDELMFTDDPKDILRIDHFGDKWGRNALGGNNGAMGGASEYYDESEYVSYPNSMRIEYDVEGSWGGVWMLFGGGGDGGDEQEVDLSDYNYLSFYIKASSAGENPENIRLELVDETDTRDEVVEDITTNWNEYVIPLNDFDGLDKTSIKQFNIMFDEWNVSNKEGIVFIDEVQFRVSE